MSMSSYVYKDSQEHGYIKFKLTTKQHNELFPKRKKRIFDRWEYYYGKNDILLHKYINVVGVAFLTLCFPIIVIVEGFSKTKNEFKQLYNQRKLGRFIPDTLTSGTNTYREVAKIIGLRERGNNNG